VIYFNVFTLTHAFSFDSLRSEWNAPIFNLLPSHAGGRGGHVVLDCLEDTWEEELLKSTKASCPPGSFAQFE
jgi:hypothetical protein